MAAGFKLVIHALHLVADRISVEKERSREKWAEAQQNSLALDPNNPEHTLRLRSARDRICWENGYTAGLELVENQLNVELRKVLATLEGG